MSKTHSIEHHVYIQRLGKEKLGLQVAVADELMRVSSITGLQILEWNAKCRRCHVKQILDQQLLEQDQIVCVNGKKNLAEMLAELHNVMVGCIHFRVRRVNQLDPAACAATPASTQRADVRNFPVVPMQNQDSAQHWTLVIKDYDPLGEPMYGYLGPEVGSRVTVHPGSESPPDSRNQFKCNYVFVRQGDTQGWIPVDILDNWDAMCTQ